MQLNISRGDVKAQGLDLSMCMKSGLALSGGCPGTGSCLSLVLVCPQKVFITPTGWEGWGCEIWGEALLRREVLGQDLSPHSEPAPSPWSPHSLPSLSGRTQS